MCGLIFCKTTWPWMKIEEEVCEKFSLAEEGGGGGEARPVEAKKKKKGRKNN